ncbi:MAG: ATP-binding cassette domain-containing protein [bacterium]
MDRPIIEFRNVSKRFDSRPVLQRVNLKIYEGHVTTVIGKSGVGKSVLLKHIIGLLKPDEGEILFRGVPIGSLKRRERDEYRGQISYMFQNNALFDSLTVFENIALPLRQTTNLGKKEIERRVMTRIEQTELTEVANKYPAEISGGMQKRTALARALVTDPKIVLFDEPTTGQDPVRKFAILSMIAEYKRRFEFTAVLISHEIPDVLFISNRVLVLHEGTIIFQGSPAALENFNHPITDEFMKSLEGLQDELTGLYSKQVFRARYNSNLRKTDGEEIFTVVLFTLELDRMNEKLGPTTALGIFKSFGEFIKRNFGSIGFSTRLSRDQMLTVLPYANLDEAEQMVDSFSRDLKVRKIHPAQVDSPAGECYTFSVFVGLAEGTSSDEIDHIIAKAQAKRKTIARFTCTKEEGQINEEIPG